MKYIIATTNEDGYNHWQSTNDEKELEEIITNAISNKDVIVISIIKR